MPENTMSSGALVEEPPPPPAENAVVYVIESSHHFRDHDNNPKSKDELLADEGWFADEASAEVRCRQLNEKNRLYYDTRMASLKRSHDAKIRQAEKANKEAAAIRAAGLRKKDQPVPPPFVAEPFDSFLSNSSHTRYEAIEVRRSDHDCIARAETPEDTA